MVKNFQKDDKLPEIFCLKFPNAQP